MSADDLRIKSPQVNAVIAVHMFGNLCDTPGLQEAIGDKPIIEDCAQSLGSKLNGRMSGSFGTMAVFSFKSGKYLSVGEGGALYTRNTELQARLTRCISEMPVPGRKEELKHVATTYIKSALRSKPLYGVAGYHLWKSFNKKMNLSEKSGVVLSQILRSDLAVACKRFSLLDSLIEAQRANAGFYSRSLELDPAMLCTERPGAFYNRYHFPITFPSQEHRDFMADFLLKRGIDSMKYLDDIVGVAVKHYGYPGDCPTAELLSKRVLVIPGYYSLGKNEIHRIVNSINSGWAEVTGTRKS